MKQRKRAMNQKRWMNKTMDHWKALVELTGNFTKFILHLMFKKPKYIKGWTIIPSITTIAEFPWNQSSLNYRDRLLPSQSILRGRVRGRICPTPMSSPFRQLTFYRGLSRVRKALNHPSRCPIPHLYYFLPFFLFTCLFCFL